MYRVFWSSTNHTGVATAAPVRRNVVRLMYFWCSSEIRVGDKVGVVIVSSSASPSGVLTALVLQAVQTGKHLNISTDKSKKSTCLSALLSRGRDRACFKECED